MICHHYKCVFIHIPKNAGQSIEHVFLDLLGLNWETRAPLLLRENKLPELGPPKLAHLKADEYIRYKYLTQEMYDNYFKFAFVRNPWGRMVSFYKYFGFDKKCDFQTFLMDEFKNNIFKKRHWFVCPQSEFVYNERGDLLVDYVGRYEELQSGFNHVCQKIGIPPTVVPHMNVSKEETISTSLKHKKSFKNFFHRATGNVMPVYKTYQEYYKQDTIDFVAEIYSEDIDLFEYKFE